MFIVRLCCPGGMTKCLEENLDILKYLSKCNCKFRKHVLKAAPKELVYSIPEAADNVLKGRVQVKPEEFNKLKKHHSTLKRLASKKGGRRIKEKRKIIVRQS